MGLMYDYKYRHYLKSLDIVPSTSFTIYKLLEADANSAGAVDVDDFVNALLYYQGPAMHVDLAYLRLETKLESRKTHHFMAYVKGHFETIERYLLEATMWHSTQAAHSTAGDSPYSPTVKEVDSPLGKDSL